MLLRRLAKAAFLWAIVVLVLVAMSGPTLAIASGGAVSAVLAALIVAAVGSSMARAAASLSSDIISGRFD